MQTDLRNALAARLLAMADDELLLGHRDSEWCGHAPILEEDIAFANIALDEMGHAALWYGLYAETMGEDREYYPDRLAFLRPAESFRNAPLVELPKGDWAFSMTRQYLFDAAEAIYLDDLTRSSHQPLADAANKARREEIYHLRHTATWLRHLGLGTEESYRRMQAALDQIWPYMLQFFEPLAGDDHLVKAGIFPDMTDVRARWKAQVDPYLCESGLSIPMGDTALPFNREKHSSDQAALIKAMQSVARLEPDGSW